MLENAKNICSKKEVHRACKITFYKSTYHIVYINFIRYKYSINVIIFDRNSCNG